MEIKRFRDLKASGQERIISVHRDDSGVQIRMLAAHFFEPGSISSIKEL
jgi:hypothetical protein